MQGLRAGRASGVGSDMGVPSRLFVAALALVSVSHLPVSFADGAVRPQQGGEPSLKVGDRLPEVFLTATDGRRVTFSDLGGRIKLISIVPQLNTPVCDEQTHHFSEQNGGIDQQVEIVTLSTNTSDDQARFAKQAKITNMRFLSDAPSREFGKETGLLLPSYGILQRAVIVADGDNVVRHLEVVPIGTLPNFDAAFAAVARLLRNSREAARQ